MDKKKFIKLAPLPPNKTVVFYSPIEGDDVLVRTGIKVDFLHILLSTNPQYLKLDSKKCEKIIRKFDTKIQEKLSNDTWDDASRTIAFKTLFYEKIDETFNDFYRKPDSIEEKFHMNSTSKEITSVMRDLIPVDVYNNILSQNEDHMGESSISDSKEILIDQYMNKIDEIMMTSLASLDNAKKKACLDTMETLFENILNICEKAVHKKFLKKSKHSSELEVTPKSVEVISDCLKRNIYFLDSSSRMPYMFGNKQKDRKSVILISLNDTRYEVVGRLLPDQVVQREFKDGDVLIKKINFILFEPEKIKNMYPELLPYVDTKSESEYSHSSDSESSLGSEESDEKSDE